MAKHPPAILAWLSWFLLFCSWAIMLSSNAALQKNCGSSSADQAGFGVDYLGPVACDQLYRYTWWITWYNFFMVVLIPILLAGGLIHKFRQGVIGLLLPITLLLIHNTNNFYLLWNVITVDVPGGLRTRAKVMFAGSLIGAIADMFLLILFGIHDEDTVHT